MKETRICLWCNKSFEVDSDSSRIYCTEKCRHVAGARRYYEAHHKNVKGENEMGKKVVINTVKKADSEKVVKSFISAEPKNENGLNFVYDKLETLKNKKEQLESDLKVIAEQVSVLEKAYEILNC